MAQSESKLVVTEAEVAKALAPDDKTRADELRAKLKTFDAQKPPAPPVAMGLTDKPGPPPKTFLLERGELSNKGVEVLPGFPVVLMPDGKPTSAAVAATPNGTFFYRSFSSR